MFITLAILSGIVSRILPRRKEFDLLNFTLEFATTLAEKVSMQALAGMVFEAIVQYKGGVNKIYLSFVFFLWFWCILMYIYFFHKKTLCQQVSV